MVSIEAVRQMITEETQKLNAIGIYPVEVKTVCFVKATSFYADAWINFNRIRVSEYFRGAPIEQIRGTIMHELLHMVPGSGRGHGAEWKKLAAKVNKNYPQYNIKRCGSQLKGGEDFSIRRAACLAETSKPRKLIIIKCPVCNHEWSRHKNSALTLHPDRYLCPTCYKPLVRV